MGMWNRSVAASNPRMHVAQFKNSRARAMLVYCIIDKPWEVEAEQAVMGAIAHPLDHLSYGRLYKAYVANMDARSLTPHVRWIHLHVFLVRTGHADAVSFFVSSMSDGVANLVDRPTWLAAFARGMWRLTARQLARIRVQLAHQINVARALRKQPGNGWDRASAQRRLKRLQPPAHAIAKEQRRRRRLQRQRTSLARSGLIDHLAARDRDAANHLSQFVSAYITPAQPLVIHMHREPWRPATLQAPCPSP